MLLMHVLLLIGAHYINTYEYANLMLILRVDLNSGASVIKLYSIVCACELVGRIN